MNLIVADTRAIMEIALDSINNWEEPEGNKIFPINNTTCWYKAEDIIELTDGRFGIPTVPQYILDLIKSTAEKVNQWYISHNVVRVENAESLLPIIETEA